MPLKVYLEPKKRKYWVRSGLEPLAFCTAKNIMIKFETYKLSGSRNFVMSHIGLLEVIFDEHFLDKLFR